MNKEAGLSDCLTFSSFAPGRRLNAAFPSTKQRAPVTATYLQPPFFFALPVSQHITFPSLFLYRCEAAPSPTLFAANPSLTAPFSRLPGNPSVKVRPRLNPILYSENGGFWSQSERVGLSNPTLVVWVQPVGARISHLLGDRAVKQEGDGLPGKMLSPANHLKKKKSLQIRHLKNFLKATGNQIFSRFNRLGFSLKKALAVFSAARQPASPPQHKKPLKQAV